MLTITHTHAEGTLIEGTAKGDGTAEILKLSGWRWGRSIASWYVPHSRDRLPKNHVISGTLEALRDAGFDVETDLDTEIRTTADVEAGKIARQEDRVEALTAKAARRSAEEEAAWARQRSDLERLPYGGEPIKVGHHSEGRHRAAIARANRSMSAASEAYEASKYAAERAETAAHTTGARYNPVTVYNRIEKLAADIRRVERAIVADTYDENSGYRRATEAEQDARAKRYAPKLAELKDQHTYWTGIRAEQVANGQATNYSKETIKAGDAVRVRGHWYTVVRPNTKTVSLDSGYTWTNKSPYSEITAHKTAEELTAAKEAKETASAE
jgi:hypothetical protein